MPSSFRPCHRVASASTIPLLAPALLIAFSFFLRLALISKGPYHVDALNLALAAEKTLDTGRIHPLFGPGYPLTVILGAGTLALTRTLGRPDPVFAVNLMSVVFSSLMLIPFYAFTRRSIEARAAFFATAAVSLFPLFLTLSVYGKSHTPSLFFLMGGLALLVRARENGRNRDLVSSAVALGLMGACRLQDLVLMIPAVSWFLWFPEKGAPSLRHRLRSSMIYWTSTGLTALAFHLPLLLTEKGSYANQFSRFFKSGVLINYVGLLSSSLLTSFRHILFGLTPVGALTVLVGFLLLMRDRPRLAVFFSLWFGIPLLFYGNLMTTAPRFLMLPTLALFPVQGVLFSRLTRTPNKAFNSLTAASFCAVYLFLFVETLPILSFRHRNALLPDFGRYVAARTDPEAWIITGDEGPFLRYYGHRRLLDRPKPITRLTPSAWRSFQAAVDRRMKAGDPVYITGSGLYSYDPDQAFSRAMKTRYILKKIGEKRTEDWHHGETILRTGPEGLFRVLPKKKAPPGRREGSD